MHVHTIKSGMCTVPGFRRVCRESFNAPREAYETLKRRGMDLVTVTDHDSIGAMEALGGHRDFFLSEEVSCLTPSGTEIHMSVFDIHERHHVQFQRRRSDVTSLLAYLSEQRLFFCINHVFSSLTGRRTAADFALFAEAFPAFESRNGHMPASSNRAAASLAGRLGKAPVAGSDSHTLRSLGLTYTEVPGARNKTEFLEGLRQGRGRSCGESGSYWKLTRVIAEIGLAMMREKAWTRVLLPTVPLVPAIMLVNYLCEFSFARKWARRLERTWLAPEAIPASEAA
jgi:predicted metal-dependent phosphoesterase TrpH